MIHAPALLRRRMPAPPEVRPGCRVRIAPAARWLLGCCLLIWALPFLTAPGNLISDTKLDLALDPGRFLARALTLWDPQQFGQLQDQVAGYLFPMGPLFYLGRLAGLEPWVIQRLWIGTVGVAAFLGTVRLAGRLGIGSPWSRIAAGFAYAASPAALTLMGELSSEFLPAAMLPWILIPLVDAAHGGRRGRAAARSAVAVALCGGINAAATLAVCVPAVVYLLTLPRPAPRWRILAWWVPAVVAATWWWSAPLALLSRYGVSIIPYTESAAVTTSATSLSNVLRGTENWVSYLVVNGQPWWRLGYWIATAALPTLLTGLAAALGLAGLIRPRLPSRRFLLCLLLTGVLLACAGYVSALGNPLATAVDHLINGPASAFRNLRKFDPLIRLPIVLGLAHLLTLSTRGSTQPSRGQAPGPHGPDPPGAPPTSPSPLHSPERQAARPHRAVRMPRLRGAAVAAAVAIGGLAVPAYAGGLAAAGAFGQIPSYWVSAANWLNQHAGRQAVLVEPGSAFGQYEWGSPIDDVLQPLTTVDFAERDLSYIGSPGNERLLDAIDQRMAAGQGSAGLTQVLARMGVRYVLVRNDLIRSGLSGAWPSRISQALATSPGMVRVARFGPLVGSASPNDAATNFDPPYPAVQIYRVRGAQPVASVQPAADALRVYGGPEALLTLAGEGLLGHRPVLLNSDSPHLPTAAAVVTDTLRRRVRNFGELRTNYSPTLTAGQSLQTFEAAADYTEPGWARYESVARYYGIKNVTASSSAAGIGAIPAQWASGLLPYAAVDGSMRTMWESGSLAGPVGQWLQLDFDDPVAPRAIRVAFTDSTALGPAVTQVVVTTATGARTGPVQATGSPQVLRVPPGATGWLRITVTGVAAVPAPAIGTQVGIKEISVPGVRASRAILAPRVPGAGPAAVVLTKVQPPPSSCLLTALRWVCSPALATATEEQYGFDQGFTAPAAGRATLRGSAVLISPSLITGYLRLIPGQPWVGASSRYTRDPQDQPRSAFDGNPATTWIASPTDARPVLTIGWAPPRTVRQVAIQRPPGASGPLQVLVSGSRGQARGGPVGPSGILRFAPMRTSRLTFLFTAVQSPLQITNIVIPGVPALNTPVGAFRLRCGLGPAIEVNGKLLPTQVSGTFADLLTGRPMPFTACSGAAIARGVNRVVEPVRDAFDVQDVVLTRAGEPLATPGAGLSGPATATSAGSASAAHASPASAAHAPAGSASTPATRVPAAPIPATRVPAASIPATRVPAAPIPATRVPAAPTPATRVPVASIPVARAVVLSWTSSRRVVQVTASARSYLVVNENFDAGWQARLHGARLRAVRIDGWKQAWLLPAGAAGPVTLTYAPNALYRVAIFGGLGALVLVALVAFWPGVPARLRRRARRPRWLARPARRRVAEQAHERAVPGGAAPDDAAPDDAAPDDAAPDDAAPADLAPGDGPALGDVPAPAGMGAGPDASGPVTVGTGAPAEAAPARSRRLRLPLRLPTRSQAGAALTLAAVVCGLLLAGLWLGGYPGAAILAAATGLFTAAFSYRRRHRVWLELSRPWLVGGLLLAAVICGVVGERLLGAGASTPLITVLTTTAPQVICLAVVGRLAAALIVGDP